MTGRLTRADPNFLSLNLLFLLVVAFLPFPIRLVTEALHTDEGETVAATDGYGRCDRKSGTS